MVDGTSSAYMSCPLRVPQRSIMGPNLILLYINDLPEHCLHVDVQLYADDNVIFSEQSLRKQHKCSLGERVVF